MDIPIRRKGKPNKGGGKRQGSSRGGRGGGGRGRGGGGRGGGGRFREQSGGGGGGGGLGKKSSSKAWDDGDDIAFASRPIPRSSQPIRRPYRSRGAPATSVPLQTLHMTSENQERVKALLRDLQGHEPDDVIDDVGSDIDDEYDEPYSQDEVDESTDDQDEDESFNVWSSPSETSQATGKSSPTQLLPEAVISPFAIGKLSRYGFDKERCMAVLRSHDSDVGSSLEHLLQLCFSETFGVLTKTPRAACEISFEECAERRQEEAFVLSSICGERFIERIPDRVWTVGMEMEYLTNRLQKPRQRDSSRDLVKQNTNNFCRFFLRGENCRFGSRCRFKHESPKQTQNLKDDSHLCANGDNYLYELEIRFPKGNKYPYQAPLVAFHSVNENLPMGCRLHIAEYLYDKALDVAQSNEPAVYTLVTFLEDEEEIVKLLGNTHHKFSVPPPLILTSACDAKKNPPIIINRPSASEKSSLPSHLPEVKKEQKPVKLEIKKQNEQDENDFDELEAEDVIVENESYVNLRKKLSKKYNWNPKSLCAENAKICKHFQTKKSTRNYQSMLQERLKLPAWQKQDTILQLLMKHQVLVISGMTGCGKTTQIPQFILDASLQGPPSNVSNIICTQPRRISAISVAERVAQERAERVGLSVGYQIRLESVKSAATRLLYCTTGVLLRRLEGDTSLQGVTHVIVDEVHERTEESDFLLLVLKDVIMKQPDLKIILMSATLNAELFSNYFNKCPVVHIPGRTFPVDQYFLEDAIAKTRYVVEEGSPYHRSSKNSSGHEPFKGKKGKSYGDLYDDLDQEMSFSLHLEDTKAVKDSVPDQQLSFKELSVRYNGLSKSVIKTLSAMDLEKINLDLIEALLEWIVNGDHSYPPGAVLVFLPGLAEIKMLFEQLQSNASFNNRRNKRCVIYPLHSSLSSEEQQAVFLKPPRGVTKIIITTNIAETSVTIDDVIYVIDSGKMREKRYDPCKSMESLEDTWVSKANALQRKGRAGRVASGVCFHLFTGHHYEYQLLEQQLPEIKRIPLEQLCLRIKILEMFSECRLESVLGRLIEPPNVESLHASKLRLQDLGALTQEEKLTPLGYHLASLPVDVRIGKLMLFGAIFRCLDPALTIAASLAFKSPFVCPWEKKEEANKKKQEFAVANSDHLALLQGYKAWSSVIKESPRAGFQFCRDNFLSSRILQEIASLKRQFTELLSDIGFVKEGLRARDIEKRSSHRGDGVMEATGEESNTNSENIKLMSAMLCAALYPNVVQVKYPEGKFQVTRAGAVKMQPKADELKFVTKSDGYVHVHPSSINYQVRHFESPYLVYHEKIKTSRVFVRDCSMVSVYPLVLFGGGQVNVELHRGEFLISLDDGWIRFAAASYQVAELVKELRSELDQLLQDKIKNPTMDLCNCPRGSRIIAMIVKLVTTQ
ncbi:putative ATP-dependent RNA helicase DHX57 [Bombina bombina]|uniref:putative ATP-dependent RNA helicase DHX57 n=1 Tax=Bombina bombina TaxID=8345 RepID=UPI00235B1C2C|nr:putative ATP-dependent RNA helicase DHX57 [Bombina bombina]